MQSAGHSNVQVANVYGIYDPCPSSIGLSQHMWHSGRRCCFLIASQHSISYIDLLDKKEGSSCSPAVRKADMSENQLVQVGSEKVRSPPFLGPKNFLGALCRVREPANLFKCEVRSPPLRWKRFLDTICRAQPQAGAEDPTLRKAHVVFC